MLITGKPRKINLHKPIVALTFDDGPTEYTSRILDTLQQHDARVSFFVMGNKVEEHKTKILRALNMDCEIICHSWDHLDLTKLSSRAIQKQLFNTIAAIAKTTQKVSLMFRPPYGYTNKKVEKVAQKLGLAIIKWSVDPNDWRIHDAATVYSSIMEEVRNGDIILCHDTSSSTAEAMSHVIPDLIAYGCQFVTVSELLLLKYGKIEPGRIYDC